MTPETFLITSMKAQKFVRLVALREGLNIKTLCKGINCTYSHAIKIITELKHQEIFVTRRSGRHNYISLTIKGRRVAQIINTLHYEMGILQIN